jgi:hypothetical protein
MASENMEKVLDISENVARKKLDDIPEDIPEEKVK